MTEEGNGIVDAVEVVDKIKKKMGRPKLLPGQETVPAPGKKLGRPPKVHNKYSPPKLKRPPGRPKGAEFDRSTLSQAHDRYFRNTKDLTDNLVNLLLTELNETVKDPRYTYEEMMSALNLAVSVIVSQMTCPDKDFSMEQDKFCHLVKQNSSILRARMKDREKLPPEV